MCPNCLSDEVDIKTIVKEIEMAPDWTAISEQKIARDGPKLTAILRKYTSLSTDNARKVVEKLNASSEKSFNLSIGGKIYVYNRLLFEVPEKADQNNWKFFGGWIGVPVNNGVVNPLFPLGKNQNGRLDLIYSFGGYAGPEYRGLSEFEYFLQRFGRRREEARK